MSRQLISTIILYVLLPNLVLANTCNRFFSEKKQVFDHLFIKLSTQYLDKKIALSLIPLSDNQAMSNFFKNFMRHFEPITVIEFSNIILLMDVFINETSRFKFIKPYSSDVERVYRRFILLSYQRAMKSKDIDNKQAFLVKGLELIEVALKNLKTNTGDPYFFEKTHNLKFTKNILMQEFVLTDMTTLNNEFHYQNQLKQLQKRLVF